MFVIEPDCGIVSIVLGKRSRGKSSTKAEAIMKTKEEQRRNRKGWENDAHRI
jgi:hypothetical protein